MSTLAPSRWGVGLPALALAATCAAVLLQPGGPAAPLLALAFVGAVLLAGLSLPLRGATLLLLFLVLAIDNPTEIPAAGSWTPPFNPLGMLLFVNFSKTTGVDALRFPLLDLLIVGLAAAVLLRDRPRPPSALAVERLLALSLISMLGIEAWGLARGGDLRNSLYQLQQLTALPVLVLIFGRTLDARRDLVRIGALLGVAVLLKLAVGLYFYEVVCRPMNWRPPYVNTHSDSVLFVVALVLVGAFAFYRRTVGALLFAGGALPLILLALYINNRRLAWVELGLVAVTLYLGAPASEFKRRVSHAMLAAVPLAAMYLAVGWTSPTGIFRPVGVVRSVFDADSDRSTETRDIENFNLIWTFKQDPLLGTGFGHEYMEMVKADDISTLFPQYRFVPHNSVLGLWAFGGLLGFSLAWLPLLAASFLALLAIRHGRTSLERTAATAALATVLTYAVQGYGDMGLQSWPATFMLALAMAMAAQLATQAGAFPAEAALVGHDARRTA